MKKLPSSNKYPISNFSLLHLDPALYVYLSDDLDTI